MITSHKNVYLDILELLLGISWFRIGLVGGFVSVVLFTAFDDPVQSFGRPVTRSFSQSFAQSFDNIVRLAAAGGLGPLLSFPL